MNDIQSPIPASTSSELESLRAQHNCLQSLVAWAMGILLLVSGTLSVFLIRQFKDIDRDYKGFRDQNLPFITQYEKVTGPEMDDFIKKLAEYGKTHPDIAPLLARYGIKVATTGAPPAPAPMPKK